MTSLASLGHSTHAATFNTTFYATVAVVIPVYFIALVVEGGTYRDLLKGLIDTRIQAGRGHGPGKRFAAIALMVLAVLILCAGAYGEFLALVALQAENAGSSWQIYIVRLSMIVLTGAVVVGPAVPLIKAAFAKGPN